MRTVIALSASLLCATSAVSAATVTLSLSSPQNGQTVSAGSTVTWTISYTVSAGDNAGLALLACDLSQGDNNPVRFDLPSAAGAPAAMTNFARPAGISNPNGYGGSQRGTAGQKNLVQIGGAQNTFGAARPAGTGVAESANVVGGLGQSGSVVLATGSFVAPSTQGAYTFSISNGVANVLQQRNDPPAFSPVIEATVAIAAPTISINVGGAPQIPGDVNGDGHVNLLDLATLLTNFGTPTGATRAMGDFDGDGDVDLVDLATLLTNFGI